MVDDVVNLRLSALPTDHSASVRLPPGPLVGVGALQRAASSFQAHQRGKGRGGPDPLLLQAGE